MPCYLYIFLIAKWNFWSITNYPKNGKRLHFEWFSVESESGTQESSEECDDCMSIKKCTKILNKNKCDGKKAKIKCQKTCGVCTGNFVGNV